MGTQSRIAGAALALALFAQPASAQDNTQVLPTIVVSPTTVPTPVNQIANSITVISGQDLERDQRRTVTDALNAVPGLQVVQNGSSGAQTSVFIRGTNSNHVKVLIDGIDVSDFEQSERRLRFRASADLRHREDRGAARPAKRPLWRERHRRRHFDHHQERLRAAESDRLCRRRLLRHFQPGHRRQRLAGPVQLRLQRRAFPLREPAGDAGLYGAAGRPCHRQCL